MKRISKLAIILAIFTACEEIGDNVDSSQPVHPVEQIPINLSVGMGTKITDTYFEQDDAVGVYVVNYVNGVPGELSISNNHYNNVKYIYGASWIPEVEMFWKDKTTKADIYCYYPYGTPGSVNAYPFAVKQDQSILSNYKKSDFVWGKVSGVDPTPDMIQLNTNHVMSNMVVYVEPGDGFTAETLAAANVSVSVRNVKTNATVNLSDGIVTATGSAAEVTPYNEGAYYRAVIVPQTVADGSALIVVTIDGAEYALKKGFTFVGGKQHKFTVTVNKTGSGINIGVGGWETDDEDNGGFAE